MSDQYPTNRPTGHYSPQPERKPFRVTWKQILLIISLIIFTIFAVTNFAQIRVNLLIAEIEAPLVVIIVISFLVGMLVSWLMTTLKNK